METDLASFRFVCERETKQTAAWVFSSANILLRRLKVYYLSVGGDDTPTSSGLSNSDHSWSGNKGSSFTELVIGCWTGTSGWVHRVSFKDVMWEISALKHVVELYLHHPECFQQCSNQRKFEVTPCFIRERDVDKWDEIYREENLKTSHLWQHLFSPLLEFKCSNFFSSMF